MAKKYAFLFPGQGAQTQGMIKDVTKNIYLDISELYVLNL